MRGVITRRRVIAAVLVCAVLVAGSAVTVLGLRYYHFRQVEDARNSALSAAKSYATTMFGFKTDNVDQHIADSKAAVVGQAQQQYDEIIGSGNFSAAVKKQRVVSEVSIQAAGVVTNTADNALVLLFMNQSVTSGDNQLVQVEPSRIEYSMRRESNTWKIYSIDILTDDSVKKYLRSNPASPTPPDSTGASPSAPSSSP